MRKRLQARARAVLARYHRGRELLDEELDSREIEGIENAGELWDARVLSTLGEADARTLAALQDALQRLDADRYGLCVDCGGEIEDDRLHVLPEAARCLACAAKTAA